MIPRYNIKRIKSRLEGNTGWSSYIPTDISKLDMLIPFEMTQIQVIGSPGWIDSIYEVAGMFDPITDEDYIDTERLDELEIVVIKDNGSNVKMDPESGILQADETVSWFVEDAVGIQIKSGVPFKISETNNRFIKDKVITVEHPGGGWLAKIYIYG
jgi:hypothetical protein